MTPARGRWLDVARRLPVWAVASCLVAALASGCGSDCPDAAVQLDSDHTIEDVCRATERTIIVRFAEPQGVETVRDIMAPMGASFACEEPAAGTSGVCYLVRLPEDTCCSEGLTFFREQTAAKASTDVPHPETPCSCETGWGNQGDPVRTPSSCAAPAVQSGGLVASGVPLGAMHLGATRLGATRP